MLPVKDNSQTLAYKQKNKDVADLGPLRQSGRHTNICIVRRCLLTVCFSLLENVTIIHAKQANVNIGGDNSVNTVNTNPGWLL